MAIPEWPLELKPKTGKFPLLYANITPEWNTIISCERQVLQESNKWI